VLFLRTYEEVRQHFIEDIEGVSRDLAEAQKVDVNNIQLFRKFQNLLYTVGGIDKQLDTSKVIENKFVEEALRQ